MTASNGDSLRDSSNNELAKSKSATETCSIYTGLMGATGVDRLIWRHHTNEPSTLRQCQHAATALEGSAIDFPAALLERVAEAKVGGPDR